MASFLYRLGRRAAARPWHVIGIWMAGAALVVAASSAFGAELEDTFEVPGLDSQLATELLDEAGSEQAGLTARVVMVPIDESASFHEAGDVANALTDVRTSLLTLTDVRDASDPLELLRSAGTTAAADAGAVSLDGRVAAITLQYPVMTGTSRAALDDLSTVIEDAADHSVLQIEAGGDLFFAFDEAETSAGEAIGVLVAIVVLLAAFGSVVAMGLPIGLALFGLAVGVSGMGLVSLVIEIPAWAPQIAAMVGLGVGIDYALFIVTRYRELLADDHPPLEAAGHAVATAGQSVIFAGGTVVVAILGLAVAGVPFLTAAGVATSVVVLLMVTASITLLPAFLGVAGPWINRLSVHRGRRTSTASAPSERWTRWGRHVARHPWPYTLGTVAVLVSLTAPVLALELGFPDEGTQPESTTQRRAYDLVTEGFGPGVNGPLLIAVDLAGDQEAPGRIAAAAEEDSGIARVAGVNVGRDVATVLLHPTTAPRDRATVDTIERLRTEVLPEALQDSPATAHVGGQTATFSDVAERVSDRLPLFIGAVVAVSFVLLVILFRSILVPLKAAILNLLSIGASYGVLVMVFQWGWAKDLVGLESTVPIVSFIPMFMFAILFGLSMDYEVFLLSRVREHYRVSGDNETSVIHGLSSTARVIASAALIMVSVFTGFAFGSDPITKMFGLGLAVAIAVDATIVRIVLVPATMKLMGDANWWLPGWLARVLPTIDLDHDATTAPRPIGDEVVATSPAPDREVLSI